MCGRGGRSAGFAAARVRSIVYVYHRHGPLAPRLPGRGRRRHRRRWIGAPSGARRHCGEHVAEFRDAHRPGPGSSAAAGPGGVGRDRATQDVREGAPTRPWRPGPPAPGAPPATSMRRLRAGSGWLADLGRAEPAADNGHDLSDTYESAEQWSMGREIRIENAMKLHTPGARAEPAKTAEWPHAIERRRAARVGIAAADVGGGELRGSYPRRHPADHGPDSACSQEYQSHGQPTIAFGPRRRRPASVVSARHPCGRGASSCLTP